MQAYQAAYNSAIIVDLSSRGRIMLTGRDRVELIQRMSTNQLTSLQAGQGALTVLTTPIARILDAIAFLHDDEAVWLITGAGRGERIRNYCQRNIFYNDQVKVADRSADTTLLGVYGARAAEWLEELAPGASALAEYHFLKHDDITVIRAEALAGNGFWLLGEPAKAAAWGAALQERGATQGDTSTYELLCIEAGIPLAEHELTEDYIPLEAGLWHAVSFSKGCYTGQEIIARMESRGKLAKMMLRLRMEDALAPGAELLVEGRKVGTLTSSAEHPAGYFLGLGFVKTDSSQAQLTTENGAPIQILGIAGTQPGRN